MSRLLGSARHGRLMLRLPSGAALDHRGDLPGVEAHLTIRRWRALRRLLAGGDIGFAEAYRDGDWSTVNLRDLLIWATQNEAALARASRGLPLARLVDRLRHRLRANTRPNSRRNVSAHYDLGNDFYARWLDAGMNYSSALYANRGQSLEAAQSAKIDRIVDLLQLQGGERVLEIGCGWGSVVERLAARHGCHVTGLTLSERQREYTMARLRAQGIGSRADIRLQDYRDLSGRFDRIVSIEMLEAVGEAFWPLYFAKLKECLAPQGTAVLQVITIEPSRFESYRRRPDFIQRHIFPGGMLPTADIIAEQVRDAGLTLTSVQAFGPSYATTLAAWRERFGRAYPAIAGLGFDARFKRTWEYYLAYCQAGFELGALDVGLFQIGHT
jgi:cyclopropane-fatty-acyl-phospholipid synthase